MKRPLEIILIYATGLMQGLILVTVPAASSVLTDPHSFGYSWSQYGALFIPQVIMSIAASLLAPKISSKIGSKKVYQAGLFFNAAAAALIAASQFLMGHPLAYICLMLATSALGVAFGTTLPMINVYAQRFFPKNPAGALTALHSLLGTGTALAPLLIILFVKNFGWWILPMFSFVAMMVLIFASFLLALEAQAGQGKVIKSPAAVLGKEFWIFILVIFLYGYCETLFSNWAIIYLNTDKSLALLDASYALSAFWVLVTLGRLLTAFLSTWIDPRWVYRALPLLMVTAFWAVTKAHSGVRGIVFFGLAGFACSSFFPLSFSFSQGLYPAKAETVSGALMASYMLGYGAASYGIGQIMQMGIANLGDFYHYSMLVAVMIAFLAFILTASSPRKSLLIY